MRKKHEKVVLKSDVFKTKTPQKLMNTSSKSPISRSPYMSKKEEDKIDPNDLFQKVCCPNCRYIFKIIKNNELIANLNSQKKEKSIVNSMTQTDDQTYKERDFRNLSNELSRHLTPKAEPLFGKTTLFKTQMDKIDQNSIQSEHLNDLTYRIEAVSSTSRHNMTKQSIKSSMRISEKRSESQLHPGDLSKNNSFYKDRLTDREGKESKQVKQMQQFYAKKEQITETLTRLHQQKRQGEEFIAFCRELPSTFEVPSYQKMLLLELSAQ